MPVVRIIAGDDNLSTAKTSQALQQNHANDPIWKVFSALAHGQGYHIAVSGAAAYVEAIAVGKSCVGSGIHNDQHDAVSVVLTV